MSSLITNLNTALKSISRWSPITIGKKAGIPKGLMLLLISLFILLLCGCINIPKIEEKENYTLVQTTSSGSTVKIAYTKLYQKPKRSFLAIADISSGTFFDKLDILVASNKDKNKEFHWIDSIHRNYTVRFDALVFSEKDVYLRVVIEPVSNYFFYRDVVFGFTTKEKYRYYRYYESVRPDSSHLNYYSGHYVWDYLYLWLPIAEDEFRTALAGGEAINLNRLRKPGAHNAVTMDGEYPAEPESELLIHAIDEYPDEIVFELIRLGADINGRDDFDRTPLDLAVIKHRNNIAGKLMSMGVPVNPLDNFGNTPLFYAAFYNNDEMLSLLYGKGGKIPYADKYIAIKLGYSSGIPADDKIKQIEDAIDLSYYTDVWHEGWIGNDGYQVIETAGKKDPGCDNSFIKAKKKAADKMVKKLIAEYPSARENEKLLKRAAERGTDVEARWDYKNDSCSVVYRMYSENLKSVICGDSCLQENQIGGNQNDDSDMIPVASPTPAPAPEIKRDKSGYLLVDTPEGLIASIKSGEKIRLKRGVYHLKPTNENGNIEWMESYGGGCPLIKSISNLTITGEGRVEVVTQPIYGWVLYFFECSNLSFSNITFGHTKPGECGYGVLKFNSCNGIVITDCVLYGSGTVGIETDNVSGLAFSRSTIKDCSVGLLALRNSKDLLFDESIFKKSGTGTLISLNALTSEVNFKSCAFSYNTSRGFFINDVAGQTTIGFSNCKFERNKVTQFANDPSRIRFDRCTFDGNSFSGDSLGNRRE